jgi:hypothetical protein
MRSIAACAAAAALIAWPALANEGDAKPASQQSRFATCAHESRGLRGEEHQKFMSECLKSHGDHEKKAGAANATQRAADETGSQQNRMRTCNEDAGRRDLHGDERRAFMSSCLKGS